MIIPKTVTTLQWRALFGIFTGPRDVGVMRWTEFLLSVGFGGRSPGSTTCDAWLGPTAKRFGLTIRNPVLYCGHMKQHFNFVANSANAKLGGMPTSYGPKQTCPSTCPLKGKGCYANDGHVRLIWDRVTRGDSGTPWPEFCQQVQALERGRIWRYGTAGDLPGHNNRIDHGMLERLVSANRGKLGYSYSHKPVAPVKGKVTAVVAAANRKAIRMACENGFMVNLSADGLCEADKLAKYGLPMVSVVPANTSDVFTTPKGLRGIVCPAQTRGLTCLQCKLCARPERAKSMPGTAGSMIIGFKPHGPGAKKVEALLSKECS